MEAPKCVRCETRHWTTQSCPAAPKRWTKESWEAAHPPAKKVASAPPPKKSAKREKAAACPERHGEKFDPPGIVVGYNFKAAAECPVCAERKARDAARAKRYREKKK